MQSRTIIALSLAIVLTAATIGPHIAGMFSAPEGFASTPSPMAVSYQGFPDKDPDSGMFLGQAGNGLSTLAGQTNQLYLGIPAGRTGFTLGIFDGDGDDHWDQPGGQVDRMDYKLYKDPLKNGATTLLDSWTNVGLADDDWTSKPYSTSSDAKAPSGNYFYRIEVNWHDPPSANDIAGFKLKVDGQISVVKSQPFCFEGAPLGDLDPPLGSGDPHPGDQNDPNANSYDGQWLFFFYVPTKVHTMNFKDGDFDRADDTDDSNTPNTDPDGPGPADAEGSNPGAPADDPPYQFSTTVPPSVKYTVTTPSGGSFTNNNPSGNQEWENFVISDSASQNPDYLSGSILQPGLWRIEVTGLDAHNLACLSAPYEVFPTDEPPLPIYLPPTVEPDRAATVNVPPAQILSFAHNVTNMGAAQVFDLTATSAHGWVTRIYRDTNGNGKLDFGEPQVNDTGTLAQNSTYKIIVQVDVPVLTADTTDVTTVRAASQLEWAVQGTVKDTITVITNRAPVPNAGGPYNGYEGSPITFDASGSSDPDNDPIQFRWDFENDGVWDTSWSSSPYVTHVWGDDYQGIFALEVSDGSLTAKTTGRVIVNNVLPSGSASIISAQQHEGNSIQFSAHVTDPGSDDLFFTWSWGDNTPNEYSTYYNNGASPDPYPSPGIKPMDVADQKSHTYGDNGVFTVTIVVRDDDCMNCTTTLRITATPDNLPPSVSVTGGMSIDEGQSVDLTATATDPGSDDLTFIWSWGEGSGESRIYYNNGAGPDPYPSPGGTWPFTATDGATHAYGDNGQFNIILVVTDDDGGSVTWSGQLVVMNLPPEIQPFGPFTTYEGSSFGINIGASDPGSDDLTFTWTHELGPTQRRVYYNDNLGPDPYPSPGPTYPFSTLDSSPYFAYGDNGIYAIALTVTDDDGGVASYSTTITITNVNPTIQPFGPFTVDEGSPLGASATASDPGSDDLKFTWTFELGQTIQNIHYNDGANPDPQKSPWGTFPFAATDTAAQIYGDNAVYSLTLTVEDDDGGSASFATQVTVLNLPPVISPFGPFSSNEGSPVVISATATDQGSDDLTFKWTFELGPTIQNNYYNDGASPDPPKSPWGTFPFAKVDQATHSYGDNAVYVVTLTVTDDDGGSADYSTQVTVANLPPTIAPFSPFYADEGSEFTVSADATDAGSDDLTFGWTFELGPDIENIHYNDGANPDPQKSPWGTFPFPAGDPVTHTYGDDGIYTLSLTVKDDDGGSASFATQIVVLNLPPTIQPFGPFSFSEGELFTTGTGATDPGSDDLTFD